VPGSIRLNGVAIDAAASYRVTVTNFLASGGDGFSMLNNGTNRQGGGQELDALAAYFKVRVPAVPGAQNRIQRLN
jgi:5'-nucleotidase